jgi:hypothetical protein
MERDDAGYDVEVVASPVSRFIEVKGSRSEALSFYLSSLELSVAERKGLMYELQFWGGIDLSRTMPDDFEILTARGYPVTYVDLAAVVASGDLVASPSRFRIVPFDLSRGLAHTRSRGNFGAL